MIQFNITPVILIFLLHLMVADGADDAGFLDAPVIHDISPELKTVTLNVGQHFSVRCTSRFPITWKAFQGFNRAYKVTYNENANSSNDEHRYVATLDFVSATYRYVGHYFCVTNYTAGDYDYSVQMVFQQERFGRQFSGVNSFYVFVDDKNNALVYREYPEMTLVYDEYLILTCKPTTNKVDLELFENHSEVSIHDRSNIYYQPTIGFIIRIRSTTEIYGKLYECRNTQRNGILFNVTYRLPEIQSATGVHGTEGDRLILNCSIPVLKGENVTITWKLPNNQRLVKSQQTVQTMTNSSTVEIAVSPLIINNLQVAVDEGYYVCEVTDGFHQDQLSQKIFIEILEEKSDKDSLEIYTLDGKYTFETEEWKGKAVIEARYKGQQEIKLEWYNNNGESVDENSFVYNVFNSKGLTVLEISFLSSTHSGNYTLRASNNFATTKKQFQLLVQVSPTVQSFSKFVEAQFGEVATFEWDVYGYPHPAVSCRMKPCELQDNTLLCDEDTQIKPEQQHVQTTMISTTQLKYMVKINNATQFAQIEFKMVNAEGILTLVSHLTIMTNETKIRVIGPKRDETVVAGDNVTLTCEVDAKRYELLEWQRTDQKPSHNRRFESRDTDTLLIQDLIWTDIESEDSGTYICLAWDRLSIGAEYNNWKTEYYPITVKEPKEPTINGKKDDEEEVYHTLGTFFQLSCYFVGLPNPRIQWYKDGALIRNSTRYSVNEQTLQISDATKKDDGNFECFGVNRVGWAKKVFKLKIIRSPIYIYVSVAVATVIMLGLIIHFVARSRQFQRELAAAGLDHFEKGNVQRLNPYVALHDQANLLPYNKKFEFPREKLKLGKHLGGGAFGVVVEACATGIVNRLVDTKVAVKMLKECASNVEIRALVGELKILVHLGQHLNIVNLLGAVTKNITRRDVMVIVEYCRFGNIQNYLLKNREMFVDQINVETEHIDSKISAREQSLPSVHNPAYQSIPPLEMEMDPSDKRIITTTDLVCWLFQVARGMAYLSSRKVVHGDLAARNVLLTDGNVVKICDFGLARSLNKYENYMKTGNDPLPIKWLAIESICDRVFSEFSDVWSFGILMWEFFSLGATPYPSYEVNVNLIEKLKDGYRMEKPFYATTQIYGTMLRCWNFSPQLRPTFEALENEFREYLPNSVAKHYINLNVQYVEMNANAFGSDQTDYLNLIRAPHEVVNQSDMGADTGYIPMKPIMPT